MEIGEKLIRYTVLVLYGIWGFIKMIFSTLVSLKFIIDLLGGIFYQPLILLLALCFFSSPINTIIKEGNNISHPGLLLVLVSVLVFVLIVNAIIELLYYLFNRESDYIIIFRIQKAFYNYAIILISLIAFWFAYTDSLDTEMNLELFLNGALFFLCVIFTDLYGFLIHSQDKVGDLYSKIIEKKNDLF